jgi:hypothetical protein
MSMMTIFFVMRKPCKHWPKRVSGRFLSSMFSAARLRECSKFDGFPCGNKVQRKLRSRQERLVLAMV